MNSLPSIIKIFLIPSKSCLILSNILHYIFKISICIMRIFYGITKTLNDIIKTLNDFIKILQVSHKIMHCIIKISPDIKKYFNYIQNVCYYQYPIRCYQSHFHYLQNLTYCYIYRVFYYQDDQNLVKYYENLMLSVSFTFKRVNGNFFYYLKCCYLFGFSYRW